jgi:glutamate racemase
LARCIGIFDSGVGGLTVVKAVRARLPDADIIYLGDTARLPYGNKSPATVEKYSRACLEFLLDRGAEAVAIACNTASATARDVLRHESPVPVIDAVTAGAERALAASKNQQIGVIATRSTVASAAYQNVIRQQAPGARVEAIASPMLVPLAEEGWLSGQVPTMVTERYLSDLHKLLPQLDTLILGCTHYPLLSSLIADVARRIFPQPVQLVDGAESMAERLADALPQGGQSTGSLRLFATDATRLVDLARLFLGQDDVVFDIVDL